MMQNVIASSNKRVVVGLGPTGLSVARFLRQRGDDFCVVDSRQSPPALAQLQQEMPDITVYAGDMPANVMNAASELIVSPGVALDEPAVAAAHEAGAAIAGDIDLFVAAANAPVVGITGSNAKSTVTELLGQMVARAGKAAGVGGNLGTPALELLDESNELYILELSSFQLERAGRLGLRVATVLNMSPDHLDRHGSMPRYHQAKHRIFRGCQAVVVNRDDPLTTPLLEDDVPLVSWGMHEPDIGQFGLRDHEGEAWLCCGFEPLMSVSSLPLPGKHNVANALAALAIGSVLELPTEAIVAAIKAFKGLPHRCELVVEANGVTWVNDSKGTNVGAAIAAVNGLGGDNNIILIAGGQGKGADFGPLKAPLANHAKALITLGEDAAKLERMAEGAVTVHRAQSMAHAVELASQLASCGDTVLLSPACASFDMFSGFAARGEAFAAAVRNLTGVTDA